MSDLGVRDQLSDRITRDRVKLEIRRASGPSLVLLTGVIVALAIGVFILVNIAGTLLAGSYTARFAVDDATAVVAGSQEVRFKGIPAGHITGIEKAPGGAIITVRYKKKFGRIFRDAHAALRPNTALQDMYLDIVDRGTRRAGTLAGDTPLPAAQTDTTVNIDDVLNTFNADTRASLRAVLDDLGNGVDGRGAQLRQAFVELAPLLRVAANTTGQLQQRRQLTQELVHNTATLTGALADNDVRLRSLINDGSVALGALQRSSPDLDATLRALPPTMRQLSSTFATVRGVLGPVDGAVRALTPVADQVPQALSDVRRLNATGAPAVRALRRPVGRLAALSSALVPVTGSVASAASALRPQVPVLDRTTKDLVGCEKGIQGFFQWDASLTKFGDSRGAVPRGNFAGGATTSGVITDPSEFAPKSCTPGGPIGGRPAKPGDKH